MSNLFWLTDAQMARLPPFFPKSHGVPRVDDRRATAAMTLIGSETRWKTRGVKPCIPGRKSRGKPIKHKKRRYRIEIMFGRLKDWRRIATRYDRCPKVFLSAIALAATVTFWL